LPGAFTKAIYASVLVQGYVYLGLVLRLFVPGTSAKTIYSWGLAYRYISMGPGLRLFMSEVYA
jgi:hypothetical protein